MIKYAITSPEFYSLEYLKSLNNKADFVLLRDKTINNYKDLAKNFLNYTKDFNYKKILHQDYNLANELKADGVHLTSNQFGSIKRAKELNLLTLISTHSMQEVKKAKDLGADIVTFSPIFTTPNKGKPKGLDALKETIECFDIKVIALGGIISKKQIEDIAPLKPYGFASIRYFLQ